MVFIGIEVVAVQITFKLPLSERPGATSVYLSIKIFPNKHLKTLTVQSASEISLSKRLEALAVQIEGKILLSKHSRALTV